MKTMRIAIVTLALAGGLAVSPLAGEGVAYRVQDIKTISEGWPPSIGDIGSLDSFALFSEGALWRTDGTIAGTSFLYATDPRWGGSASTFRAHNGRAFFLARAPGVGQELWTTDGTPGGTLLVRDIRPGAGDSNIDFLALVGQHLYFVADDGVHGRELWVSDGTEAGTHLVLDIRAGAEGAFDLWWTEAQWLGKGLGGRLYFAADDGAHGLELWRSDGTEAGTYLLKNIQPGGGSSYPMFHERAGGLLFFTATDDSHGRELWATDGSAAGTRLVRDVRPGPESSGALALGAIGTQLVFAADDGVHGSEVWKSDGTFAGTTLLKDVHPGPETSSPWESAAFAGRVVFGANDGVHGKEPWVTDGTAQGTRLLVDVWPGALGSMSGLGASANGVYFGAWEPSSHLSIWRTDGTPAGTVRGAALPDRPGFWSWTEGFEAAGDRVVFRICFDDDFRTYYCEPWGSDGTAAGTVRLRPWNEVAGSYPQALTARSGGIVFSATSDFPETTGWVFGSDGSEAGTHPLAAIGGPVRADRQFVSLPDGEVLFVGSQAGTGDELWRSDGDQISQVSEIRPGTDPPWIRSLNRVGSLVYFSADDGWTGHEPWVSDGSVGGTYLVRDLNPGSASSDPSGFAEVAGRAWFSASEPQTGTEIWESGGTEATTFVHDLSPGTWPNSTAASSITPVGDQNGTFAFVSGQNLEFFDAPTDTASIFRTLDYTFRAFTGAPLAVLGGRIFFFDLGFGGQCTLWRSDGTAAGTVRLKTVGWGPDETCPTELVVGGGQLYFSACGPLAGCELWKSDGSPAGTVRVADLEPGPGSSIPTELASIGDRLYFSACQWATGCEPWVTDGSAAGTHRLADIAPGPASSRPAEFTASGRLVYFRADDGTGSELWAMPMELFYDGFETGDKSRWDPPAAP